MIKQGQQIEIKPEFQDEGDAALIWIAIEDEDGGRVKIKPINSDLPFPPVSVALTEWLQ